MFTPGQVEEIFIENERRIKKQTENPELRETVKDIIQVIKKHRHSFWTAKEALFATITALDNSMLCRITTPYKKEEDSQNEIESSEKD